MRYTIPRAQDPVDPEYLRHFWELDRMATLHDSKYRVPYTQVRFAWHPIVGLLPIVGDLAAAAVSLHLVRRAHILGADSSLASRMVLNVLVDTLLGAVPIIGTIFDIYFRANERNLRLLVDSIEGHRRR